MNSAITTILTDETARTPKAVDSLVTKSVEDKMLPWLSKE